MVTDIRKPRFYLPVLIALCFFAGIALGTVWVNLMSEEIKEELSVFGQAWMSAGRGKTAFAPEQVIPVLIRREMGAAFLWLVGMTLFSVPGLLALSLYGGFSMASIVSMMTVQAGLMGMPLYLLSVFPQALFYVPVIGILFLWGIEPYKKTHLAGFLVLTVFIAAGAVAETCLNPYFISVFHLSW